MFHMQVVNINNLGYTKSLIHDLRRQTVSYHLTLIDQGSTEAGTQEYLRFVKTLKKPHVEVIENGQNVPLNRLWNRLFHESHSPYLCFMNNDMRVASNFVEHTMTILDREPDVGAVVHPTNHPRYQTATKLHYIVLDEKITQGWDFTMRKEAFTEIPNSLEVFGGDDWLFDQMYQQGYKTAVALSSPVIHFHAKSRKYYQGDRGKEAAALVSLGVERYSYLSWFNKTQPKFEAIIEREG